MAGENVTPPLHTDPMSKQLRLIDQARTRGGTGWRLDEQTRTIGRNGVAAAREALRASRPRYGAPTSPKAA